MNKLKDFRLLLLFIIITTAFTGLYAQFAGGSGTSEDPYQVATAEHLNNIRNYLDSHFIQIADIDLDVAPFNQDGGWVPIGFYSTVVDTPNIVFTGSYNGDDNIIQNLMINGTVLTGAAGLFGYADHAIFRNIQVSNCNVSGAYMAAGLLGYGTNDSLYNCHASGIVSNEIVSSDDGATGGLIAKCDLTSINNCSSNCVISSNRFNTGGLAGYANHSTMYDCYSSGSLVGGGHTGGLVGQCHYLDVIDCFSTADITATLSNTGGLMGWGARSNIDRCYVTGNVNGNTDVGGLCGHLDLCYVTNCFARGAVSGTIRVGGLVGRQCIITYITNSYATGIVTGTGTENIGGMVGETSTPYLTTNCYWDMQTSGQTTSASGEGRTTLQMTYPYNPDTYVEWDFENIWANDIDGTLNDGYPIFGYMIPVANEDDVIPAVPSVTMSNYPNPFRYNTSINFNLPKSGQVSLSIYNSKGQLVRTLTESNCSKGEHLLTWDGKTDTNQQCANGIYLYRLQGTGFSLTRKLLLSK